MMQRDDRHVHSGDDRRPYLLFAVNMALSLAVMYLVMFAMIDGWQDFRNNLNTFYMALAMVAPMGVLMLATMGHMYRRKRLNLVLHAGFIVLFVAALAAIRMQSLIDDREFIRSMIPHHSGAILMCREADLADRELIDLCGSIVEAQRSEIEQMEAIRDRLL